MIAPLPANEVHRLSALDGLKILDTPPEQAFDDIVFLAAQMCNAPIALISLVGDDRQWFKARIGWSAQQTHRDLSFCAHAILQPAEVLVVEDALRDPRFADNALVTGEPGIRFYAGAPIVTANGEALGTVCVIDHEPRSLDDAQVKALQALSRQVMVLLERRGQTQSVKSQTGAKAALNRQRIEHLLAVADSGLDLQSFVDTHYVYRYVNPVYLDYWNLDSSDIEGLTVAQLSGEELFNAVLKPQMDRALAGESVQFQTSFDFPGRGRRFVDMAYIPVRDSDGTVIGIVVRKHDIHSLREVSEQLKGTVAVLEEQNLKLQSFVHTLSHDFREPVNTLANYSALLDDEYRASLPPLAQRFVGHLRSGSQRLSLLLDDLMTMIHLEQDSVTLEPCSLTDVVDNVVNDLASSISKTGAQIRRQDLPVVQGQDTLLRLLVQNLITNSIKFVPKGTTPEIDIVATKKSDECELLVVDNGIGIDEPYREKVFELFTRLNSRKEYEGTGFGLAACRRITKLHGGRIWVTAASGGGSCFHVVLPLAKVA